MLGTWASRPWRCEIAAHVQGTLWHRSMLFLGQERPRFLTRPSSLFAFASRAKESPQLRSAKVLRKKLFECLPACCRFIAFLPYIPSCAHGVLSPSPPHIVEGSHSPRRSLQLARVSLCRRHRTHEKTRAAWEAGGSGALGGEGRERGSFGAHPQGRLFWQGCGSAPVKFRK